MEINDRINQIIEHESLSIASFARKVGIGDQTIRSVCVQKRNKPGYDVLAAIVSTFDWLNAEWLLTGEGEMIKKTDSCSSLSADKCADISPLVEYLREKDKQIEGLIEEKTVWRLKYEHVSGLPTASLR